MVAADDGGQHELVVFVAAVGGLQRGDGVGGGVVGVGFDDGLPGEFQPVPALVAVHGVIAADDRGHAHVAFVAQGVQALQAGFGRPRRHVAAVQEGVHGDVGHAFAAGQFDHGEQVVFVAVHAARRQQAEQVQGAGGGPGGAAGGHELGVFEEAAVFDGGVHAREVLVDDAAGADVHVAHFGIAHLAVRQAHVLAFGVHQGVRAVGQQAAPVGQPGLGQGVVGGVLAVAPAVEDEQKQGLGAVGGGQGGLRDVWHGRIVAPAGIVGLSGL